MCLRKQDHEKKLQQELKDYDIAKPEVLQYYHLVQKFRRNKFFDCKHIPGSRSLHSVSLVSHRDICQLKVRAVACFCCECMDDNNAFCERAVYVKPWDLITIQPKRPQEVSILCPPIYYCISCCFVPFYVSILIQALLFCNQTYPKP